MTENPKLWPKINSQSPSHDYRWILSKARSRQLQAFDAGELVAELWHMFVRKQVEATPPANEYLPLVGVFSGSK